MVGIPVNPPFARGGGWDHRAVQCSHALEPRDAEIPCNNLRLLPHGERIRIVIFSYAVLHDTAAGETSVNELLPLEVFRHVGWNCA